MEIPAIVGGGLVVIEDISLESKRTKDAVAIINNLGAEKVLFIEPERVEGLELSTRNIPGVKTLIYKNINPHDLINHSKVVVLESAHAKIEEVVL